MDPTIASAPYPAIFQSFFKIGAFTFGGGWAMVPLIRRELCERRGWLEDADFCDLVAIAQTGPGPIAVNVATLAGYRIRGYRGALVAVLGAVLPSFIAILALASVLAPVREGPVVDAVFLGMRPAILGLLLAAVLGVGKSAIGSRRDLLIATLATIVLVGLKVHPVVVVALAGAIGVAVGVHRRSRAGVRHEAQKGSF